MLRLRLRLRPEPIDTVANPLLAQVWDGRLPAQVAMEQIHRQVQTLLDSRHK